MNYTAQVRKDIKRECKARVKERLGSCVGIQFLYMLPFLLLTIIMLVSIYGGLFNAMVRAASAGMMLTDEMLSQIILNNVMHGAMNTIWLTVLVSLVISGPLMYGLMKFYIALRRGEEPHVGMLFKPFTSGRSLWAGIKMSFCLTFRALLWLIVPMLLWMIVFIAVVVSAAMAGATEPPVGFMIASYIVLLLIMIPIEIKVMTYQAGWMVINENEEYGVWAATRDASRAFKGHYGKLLVFALSFILWYLLLFGVVYGCIGLGIAGIAMLGAGSGIAVFVVALIAGFCLDIVLSAFISAYTMTSFIGLYEYFAQPPAAPVSNAPFYQPQQTVSYAPGQVPQPAPEQPEVPVPEPQEQPEAPAPEEPAGGDSDDNTQSGE